MIMKSGNSSKDKLFKIIVVFIVAPIIGLSIGISLLFKFDFSDIINKYSTEESVYQNNSELQNNNEEDKIEDVDGKNNDVGNTDKIEFDLEDFSLYNVQVGSFSSIENSKALINQVKDLGLGGYIFKIEEDYKVFLASFFSRESADEYMKFIKEHFNDSFINEKIIKGKTLLYSSKDESDINSVKVVTEKMRRIYEKETIVWKDNLVEVDTNKVRVTIYNNNIEIEVLLSKIKQFEGNELDEYVGKLRNNLQVRKNIIQKIDDDKLIEAYVEFNQGLVDFINTVSD